MKQVKLPEEEHRYSAVASANLCPLVETAKANGVEPHGYLSRLFERLLLEEC